MHENETRVRTQTGVLVVTDDHVRLERGALVRRTVQQIPRARVTRVHLTSRFHGTPALIGGLLLAGSIVLTVATATLAALLEAPASVLTSLALVLVVTGSLFLLSMPLAWRAVLEVASRETRIRVHTGYKRRPRLEKARARLHEPPTGGDVDLVKPHAPINTPSGSRPGSG